MVRDTEHHANLTPIVDGVADRTDNPECVPDRQPREADHFTGCKHG